MPVLVLSRPKALTVAEIKLLPKGTVATDGKSGVVARAELDLPLAGLLGYAFALGRAVPDAFFSVEGLSQGAPPPESGTQGTPHDASPPATDAPAAALPAAPARATSARATPAEADDVITESDPWKLVAAGQIAQAERVFAAGNGLDSPGRERCRQLLASRVPDEVALGCRVARITNWRSVVMSMRALASHAHPSVRRDAAEAIGALAGPSMASVLRPLLADPDAEVKATATAALQKLGG